MLKAIVLAAILGMLFPVAGHVLSGRLSNNWLRFGISIIFLIVSILISYYLALIFKW
ncbi:hypothetical protein UF75_4099 [Desulfosporosinus sp. I2]|uniref:hypothetical protein n=1 Tax=Desulfosporosinus sp. I2 TaxID=1617025 RepID=UPI00061E3598|nr:hypothetical protein [Desulfosporosinus sp. I2]KJR45504.1 hypothetical protein UF75_4099 [Desulfosporosinus sp. I2]